MIQSQRRLVAINLFPFLLSLLFFAADRQTFFQRRQSATKSVRAERVVELFRNNCARCHGADGRGDTPLGHLYNAPDFTDGEWWRKHSNLTNTASLNSIVTRGKAGMPAFGKKLTRNEIRSLVIYVRRFQTVSRSANE